jgi:tRNA (guanine37-N1)-methyltransferase
LPGYAGPPLSQSQRRMQSQSSKIISKQPPLRGRIAHFVMNLPDSAITFLDAFRGMLTPLSSPPSPSESTTGLQALYDVMPMVHCYCFTRELERNAAERDIRQVRPFIGSTR